MASAAKVIAQAAKYVGYLEKKSNYQLDSFTANAGSANWTRFGRDYGLNPAQWCGIFVSQMFVEAFGKEKAKELLCGSLHHYTPTGASLFKNADQYIKRGKGTPKPGDVIFFYSSAKKRIGHVGIVEKVSGGRVYTIEGNTSGASTLVTNGGGVCRKSYSLTSSYIDGYGRVKYDESENSTQSKTESTKGGKVMIALDELQKGSEGEQVKTVQRLLKAMNYSIGKDGVDGDFGKNTDAAVRKFQKANGLGVDGIVGQNTWTALLK